MEGRVAGAERSDCLSRRSAWSVSCLKRCFSGIAIDRSQRSLHQFEIELNGRLGFSVPASEFVYLHMGGAGPRISIGVGKLACVTKPKARADASAPARAFGPLNLLELSWLHLGSSEAAPISELESRDDFEQPAGLLLQAFGGGRTLFDQGCVLLGALV